MDRVIRSRVVDDVPVDMVVIEDVRRGDRLPLGDAWLVVREIEVEESRARMHFDHGPGGWQPRGMPVGIRPEDP